MKQVLRVNEKIKLAFVGVAALTVIFSVWAMIIALINFAFKAVR